GSDEKKRLDHLKQDLILVLTLIIEKIRKFEDLLTSGQAILVDKVGFGFLGEYDSEDEVALVDNDMTRSMAYERVGFG
ncbi:hypothetical protein Tco_1087908, partial [Tanacetum coccineum]